MESQFTKVVKDLSEALDKDPRTKGTVIDLGFNGGVATLTGNVKNAMVYQAVEEIARAHPEVISVVNELKVG